MLSSACILSSSALLYCFLVPIVLRELVSIVVSSPENFESFASSITVERLPGLPVGFEFWSLIESPTDSSNPEIFVSLLQDRLGESVELCCSVTILPGRNNVPVSARRSLQYSSHIEFRENPCCVSARQSPPLSMWEKVPPSSWRNHSVSFG